MPFDTQQLALALVGLFVAGIVKGGSGLGFSTCAIPFLVPAIGLRAAMLVVLAPAIATNIDVALAAGHFRETLRRFRRFYLATLPGILCGVTVLTWSDAGLASRCLGIVLLAYAVFALTRPGVRLPTRVAAWLQAPAGFANGVVTGLTGSQVMPLLPFMMSLNLEPDRFVQAVNLSVLVSTVVLAALLTLSGAVDHHWLVVSLGAVLPSLLGVRIGNAGRRYIPAEHFRILVLLLLLAMGVMLAVR